MNKKIIIGLFLIGCILGIYRGYVEAASTTPVTITVQVHSLQDGYEKYMATYPDGSDGSPIPTVGATEQPLNSAAAYACALYGSGVPDGSNYLNAVSEWCSDITLSDGSIGCDINPAKFTIGTYNFSWSDSGVQTNAVYGQNYSDSNSYKFTFPDSKNVNLVLESSGLITGDMVYDENSDCRWKGVKGGVNWFRTNAKDSYSSYKGLDIKQSNTSNMIQITNVDNTSANDITINVYVSGNSGSFPKLQGDNIYSGNKPVLGEDYVNYDAPAVADSGYAAGYSVGTNPSDGGVDQNTWEKMETLVNNFIDEIKMISWFYYGIAFLTSVLMIIINIIKTAGAPNNPMFKTRIYIDLGVSFLCLALLGASVILTRLFILTCLG